MIVSTLTGKTTRFLNWHPQKRLRFSKEIPADTNHRHFSLQRLTFCHVICNSKYIPDDLEALRHLTAWLQTYPAGRAARSRACQGCGIPHPAPEWISPVLLFLHQTRETDWGMTKMTEVWQWTTLWLVSGWMAERQAPHPRLRRGLDAAGIGNCALLARVEQWR